MLRVKKKNKLITKRKTITIVHYILIFVLMKVSILIDPLLLNYKVVYCFELPHSFIS